MDVARIDLICEQLKIVWKNCPNITFGQLISAIFEIDGNYRFYNITDETVLKYLKIQSHPVSSEDAEKFFAGV